VNDLSILQLILEATVIVQAVMLMLVLASVYSWSIIFKKRAVLGRAKDDLARFEKDFWSGGDLSQLYKSIESRGNPVGIDSIFRAFASAR
jgi:biopolymer transport protein TolQ